MSNTGQIGPIVERIAAIRPRGTRCLVAIGGPPGAGKADLAMRIVAFLLEAGSIAVCVPVDGFLLDNRVLRTRGLLARRGAPETFDRAGLATAVDRLSREAEVALPVPEHAADNSVAGALMVRPEHEIVVLHGDFLCLDEPPWNALAEQWDLSIYLDTPPSTLRERLIERWTGRGLEPQAATMRVEEDALFNARRISRARGRPDIVLSGG